LTLATQQSAQDHLVAAELLHHRRRRAIAQDSIEDNLLDGQVGRLAPRAAGGPSQRSGAAFTAQGVIATRAVRACCPAGQAPPGRVPPTGRIRENDAQRLAPSDFDFVGQHGVAGGIHDHQRDTRLGQPLELFITAVPIGPCGDEHGIGLAADQQRLPGLVPTGDGAQRPEQLALLTQVTSCDNRMLRRSHQPSRQRYIEFIEPD
jgi:hypothetical protein